MEMNRRMQRAVRRVSRRHKRDVLVLEVVQAVVGGRELEAESTKQAPSNASIGFSVFPRAGGVKALIPVTRILFPKS